MRLSKKKHSILRGAWIAVAAFLLGGCTALPQQGRRAPSHQRPSRQRFEPESIIRFINGDEVEGLVESIDDERVTFKTSYATLTIPPERVLSIIDISTKAPVYPVKRTWEPESIAVADLTPLTLSREEVRTLTEVLHATLAQTKYFDVLARSEIQTVLETQQFRGSGACDDAACLVEMGKLLSVQKIVGGSVGRVGTTYSITVRLVDVETGKTEITVYKKLRAEPDGLLDLIADIGRELSRRYAEAR